MSEQTRMDALEADVLRLQEEVTVLRKQLLEHMPSLSVEALDAGTIKARGMLAGAALPPNLIRNSWMDLLEGMAPAGYGPLKGSRLIVEAVHPYTKGFEGPYSDTPPTPVADSVDAATQAEPFWYGRFNKGSRIRRGGLAGGWHSFGGGHILKVTGDNSGPHTCLGFPFETKVLVRLVRLTGWLKIARGTLVCFGPDAGYRNRWLGHVVTREQTERAPDGWHRVNTMIGTSHVTSLDGLAFSMGIQGQEPDGSFEVYLALPYMANLDHDSWLPSVSDMVRR